jgi:hypothetical protein
MLIYSFICRKKRNIIFHYILILALRIAFKLRFAGIYLHKSDRKMLEELPKDYYLILTPNHSSWWDGFISYVINLKLLKRAFSILMLNSELNKYPFFKLVGALGITQASAASIKKTFKIINEEIKQEPPGLINFYPQGKLLPSCIKELELKDGLKLINHPEDKALILPVYFHEESGRSARSQIFIKFGLPLKLSEYKEEPSLLKERLIAAQKESFVSIRDLNLDSWHTVIGSRYIGY